MDTKPRTRFAPSPTGSMHIGNLRTAFYAYAMAKHQNGDFILRIEDTDKKRESKGGVNEIKSLLSTFSITWDEYYVQSERLEIYKAAAERLVKESYAFYCQCEGKNAKEDYSSKLRDPCRDMGLKGGAVKLKVPENEEISFRDFILNENVSWNTQVVFDATLLKSDGFPTYHLAVVVDDHDMKVSHVLRGHDWMPSTPIHLLVYKFLGYDVPKIGHLTDILDPEGGKLSKRKGSISVKGLLGEGYLPEAIFNFVILVGWAPKDNREMYTLDEFVKEFSPSGFQKANPVFNRKKLDWMNSQYLAKMSDSELADTLFSFFDKRYDKDIVATTVPLIKTRIKTLADYEKMAGFFFEKSEVDTNLLSDNYDKQLGDAVNLLESVVDWKLDNVNEKLMELIKKENYKTGEFFMNLRIAITGEKYTPPINDSIVILGKDETLSRLTALLPNNVNKKAQ